MDTKITYAQRPYHSVIGGGPGIPTAPRSGYIGPGDIFPSASWWVGLRGYNGSYSTGVNPAMDVVDTATGLITTTIFIKSDGSVDAASIAALGYNVSVKKLYDQTGNGNHATQNVLGNMPTITLNGLGSFPTMVFVSGQVLNIPVVALTKPYSFSSVDKTSLANAIVWVTNSLNTSYYRPGIQQRAVNSGAVAALTATDGSFYAVNAVVNGGSSVLRVNGTEANPVDTGGNSPGTQASKIALNFTGTIQEFGMWVGSSSLSQRIDITANQRNYWVI